MPGVWTWGFGEAWGLHYLDSVGARTTTRIGRGYETFGNATAETVERTLRSSHKYVDRPVTDREWYRAWPPDKKFVWSLRDNTNYMETGCLSILDWTAQELQGGPAQLLPQGLQLLAEGREGQSLRVRHPREPGRPPARGADDRGPARPPHRGVAARRAGHAQGGDLRRRAASSSGSTSRIATTRSTCSSRRSSRAKRRTSPTTTCRGPCPCTTALEATRDRRREDRRGSAPAGDGRAGGRREASRARGPSSF